MGAFGTDFSDRRKVVNQVALQAQNEVVQCRLPQTEVR